ncbi:MAG: RNA polymerase sigma factor [Vicinamibacterales bacterium]
MSPFAAHEPIALREAQEFEQVYREHAPLVYRTAWGVLGSREDAEDVVQAVFLKLLRSQQPANFQPNPRAYLYKAAVNASLDVLKARRRRPVLVDDIERLEIAVPESFPAFDEETHRRLYEAIARLSAEAAETVLLRYMQNMSVAEIAAQLGVSRTVVAVRLFRTRARLRTLLRTPEGTPSGVPHE